VAGRLTLWGAGEILRSFFGKTAEPPPDFYLALIKDLAPNPYVSGSELDEPTVDQGYVRVQLPNDAVTWNSGGMLHIVANEVEAAFITATSDWGRIGYWAVCNAEQGGYVYFVGEMEENLSVLAGDQAVVGAGELVIELGPFFTDEDF
jgi:hypothetical protein